MLKYPRSNHWCFIHVRLRSVKTTWYDICQYTRDPRWPKQKSMGGFHISSVYPAVNGGRSSLQKSRSVYAWPKMSDKPRMWMPFSSTAFPLTTTQVKLYLCLINHNVVKRKWRKSIAPRILDLGATCVYITAGKDPRYLPGKRLCGPQSLSGRGEHEKNLCLETKPDSLVQHRGA
jgi:hypothetical protein